MTIRLAKAGDARAIAEVHVASSRAAYRDLVPAQTLLMKRTISQREQIWQKILSEHETATLVLEERGRLIGFVNVGATRDPDKEAAVTAEINSIYLAPEHWGQGHGQRLCQSALAHLRRAGFREATLWVLAENQRARRFYEKLGFRFEGTMKTREKDGLRIVRYVLELG